METGILHTVRLGLHGSHSCLFFYHPKGQYIREEGKTVWQQLAETDFAGCFLLISGLPLFLLGNSFGGQKFPWTSAGTLAPLIVGLILLIVLGVYEAKAKLKYPVFPPAIFRETRSFTVVVISVFLVGMQYYSTAVLWPQQVAILYMQDPVHIGLFSMALGLGGTMLSPTAGWLFKKFKHGNYQFPIYLLIDALLSGLQATVTADSRAGSTILVVLMGGVNGALIVISTAMVQVGVPHEYIGAATGVAICLRSVGGAVANTIFTTILQSEVTDGTSKYLARPLLIAGVAPPSLPAVIQALFSGSTTSPALASLTPSMLQVAINGAKNTYVHAFRVVYLVSIALGVCATVAGAFTKNTDHLMTATVEMTLREDAPVTHIHHHEKDGADL